MIVLGIETSCDETSCAVVKDGRDILANTIASSLKLHRKYRGIIPEIASRAHLECISFVVREALRNAAKSLSEIDLICVTQGPGLVGSLLVGVSFTKALSLALNKPILGINHLEAHLYASFLSFQNGVNSPKNLKPSIPFVGLVISGGHTSLFLVKNNFGFKLIGSTSDDAVGETFDKVAAILGQGYPGGPIIERMAAGGKVTKPMFSCRAGGGLDFSFSGIKTAFLYKVKGQKWQKPKHQIKVSEVDLAAGFQKAVGDVLIEKSFAACRRNKLNTLVIGGGVAANSYLRERFKNEAAQNSLKVYFPQAGLSLDNAAMIAGLGYQLFKNGRRSNNYLTVEPLPIRNSAWH